MIVFGKKWRFLCFSGTFLPWKQKNASRKILRRALTNPRYHSNYGKTATSDSNKSYPLTRATENPGITRIFNSEVMGNRYTPPSACTKRRLSVDLSTVPPSSQSLFLWNNFTTSRSKCQTFSCAKNKQYFTYQHLSFYALWLKSSVFWTKCVWRYSYSIKYLPSIYFSPSNVFSVTFCANFFGCSRECLHILPF